METNLLDRMLTTYLSSKVSVTITLQNKIRVSGTIKAFDSYVILMEGQKREIVYRHAVSSVVASAVEEPKKRQTAPSSPEKQASRPARTPPHKPRSSQQAALSASSSETSINNSMKEGLLKWMQEQKATK